MNNHLSSQIHDIVTAHVSVALHRETFFLSGSKTHSSYYKLVVGLFLFLSYGVNTSQACSPVKFTSNGPITLGLKSMLNLQLNHVNGPCC